MRCIVFSVCFHNLDNIISRNSVHCVVKIIYSCTRSMHCIKHLFCKLFIVFIEG